MNLVLESPTPAGMLAIALAACGPLGWFAGLLSGWLSLRGADQEGLRQARPIRWSWRGLAIGIAFAIVFWVRTKTAPPGTEVLLFPTLFSTTVAVTFMIRGGSGGLAERALRGMLVGALAAIGVYAVVADPAAVLTVLGLAVWGPPLVIIGRLIVPGRSRPSEGSDGGWTLFITLMLFAIGAGLVLDGGWRAPWLPLTPVAVVLAWIGFCLALGLLLMALGAILGRFLKRTHAARPLPFHVRGEDNEGPIILLAHGLLVEAEKAWDNTFIDGLLRKGCVVVLLEMPWGPEGDRPGLFEPVLGSTRRALDATMDILHSRWPDKAQIMIGHSYSGGFGLTLVERPHPAMRALLVTEPVGLEMFSNLLIGLTTPVALGRFVPGFSRLLSLVMPRVRRLARDTDDRQSDWFMEELLEFAKAALAIRVGPKTRKELRRALPPRSVAQGLYVSALFAQHSAFVRAKSAARLAAHRIPTDSVPGSHDLNKHYPTVVLNWVIRELVRCGQLSSQGEEQSLAGPLHPANESPEGVVTNGIEDPAQARQEGIMLAKATIVTPSSSGPNSPPRVMIPPGEWPVLYRDDREIVIAFKVVFPDEFERWETVVVTTHDLETALVG